MIGYRTVTDMLRTGTARYRQSQKVTGKRKNLWNCEGNFISGSSGKGFFWMIPEPDHTLTPEKRQKNGSPVRIRHRRCAGAKRRQPPIKNHYGTTSAGKKKNLWNCEGNFISGSSGKGFFWMILEPDHTLTPEKRQKNGSPVRIRTSTKWTRITCATVTPRDCEQCIIYAFRKKMQAKI